MFIRVKKIKGQPYAYLVENTWAHKGARQKVLKYLGRVHPIPSTPIDADVSSLSYPDAIKLLLRKTLTSAGFTGTDVLTKDGFTVDLTTLKVTAKNRSTVLKSNEGFISDHTISDALQPPTGKHQAIAHALASKILEAGIKTTPETFASLFEKVKPKDETKLQEFYY
jgi:hypothetical protein